MSENRLAPLVTIAALYGAGESVIGPRVAEALDVPLLDRSILHEAARRTGLREEAIAQVDEEPRDRVDRFVASLARATTVSSPQASSPDNLDLQERRLRGAIEEALATTRTSGGVAIGRGGMVVLQTVPWALHVQLTGPRDARIEQGRRLEGIEYDVAREHQEREDRARVDYVRRAYGVDGADPIHYHLVLDSTALALEACAELIVAAAEARLRQALERESA